MQSFKQFLDKPTPSPEEIATKFKVSLDYVRQQLQRGIGIEMEHTSDRGVATEIVLDHLGERPDYYEILGRLGT